MEEDDTDNRDSEERLPSLPLHEQAAKDADGYRRESGIHEMDRSSTMTASQSSLLRLSTSETSLKHVKLEGSLSQTSLTNQVENAEPETIGQTQGTTLPPIEKVKEAKAPPPFPSLAATSQKGSSGLIIPDGTAASQSASSLSDLPLKATTFLHLSKKYLTELEYMLVEFQKLEKQLLGAKTMQSQESAGSKERREKLHSFILHLQETITQIHSGCELEAAGKSTVAEPLKSTGLAQPTKEKEEEENVQKLEEHILANLLPVKVRLKKQLAAQKGAKHNPAGMPVRGVADAPKDPDAGASRAFLTAAQQRGPQFGKPLDGGGSSLTQKLHGSTLGSQKRIHGHGVGQQERPSGPSSERKILYAGMALGSKQMESSVSAASSAHRFVVQNPALLELNSRKRSIEAMSGEASAATVSTAEPDAKRAAVPFPTSAAERTLANAPLIKTEGDTGLSCAASAEERRKLRRKRRKKKRLLREQQQQVEMQQRTTKRKKGLVAGGKNRGPRSVEYMCALCNEVYNYTCDFNPWWALSQHDCPKCHKKQIPRVDISAPANAIEYHPALLAHADDNGAASAANTMMPPAQVKGSFSAMSDTDDSDLSDDYMSDDSTGSDESDLEALTASMSPAERAEYERFGAEYSGPELDEKAASRLLVLMLHASICPCRHKSAEQRDVCRSTKWMMMHVRDCPGTTATFDVCPFPWCRKVKHLLYHLVSCPEPDVCEICSPSEVSHNMNALRALNDFRVQQRKESLARKAKAASKGKSVGNRKTAKSTPDSGKSQQKHKPAAAHASQQNNHPSITKVAVVAKASEPDAIPDAVVSSKTPAIAKSTSSAVSSVLEALPSKPIPSTNGENSAGPVVNPPLTSQDKGTNIKNPQIAMAAAAVVDSSLPKSSSEIGPAKQNTDDSVTKEDQSGPSNCTAMVNPPVSKPSSEPYSVMVKEEEEDDNGKNPFQLQAMAAVVSGVKAEQKEQPSTVSRERSSSQSTKEPSLSCSVPVPLEDKSATHETIKEPSKETKANPQVEPSTKTTASVCNENASSTKALEASSCSKCGTCSAAKKNKDTHSGLSATVVE